MAQSGFPKPISDQRDIAFLTLRVFNNNQDTPMTLNEIRANSDRSFGFDGDKITLTVYNLANNGYLTVQGEGKERRYSITEKGIETYLDLVNLYGLEFQLPPSSVQRKQVHGSLLLNSASIIASIDDYREKVRGNNRLTTEEPELKQDLLDFLTNLESDINKLIDVITSDSNAPTQEIDQNIKSWHERYFKRLFNNLKELTHAEHSADLTIPPILMMLFGGMGTLIDSNSGFTVGSLAGLYIAGQVKPQALSKKVEEYFKPEKKNEEPPNPPE